ncbi:unnamed protein product, partial [Protopolystoma xenopodis]
MQSFFSHPLLPFVLNDLYQLVDELLSLLEQKLLQTHVRHSCLEILRSMWCLEPLSQDPQYGPSLSTSPHSRTTQLVHSMRPLTVLCSPHSHSMARLLRLIATKPPNSCRDDTSASGNLEHTFARMDLISLFSSMFSSTDSITPSRFFVWPLQPRHLSISALINLQKNAASPASAESPNEQVDLPVFSGYKNDAPSNNFIRPLPLNTDYTCQSTSLISNTFAFASSRLSSSSSRASFSFSGSTPSFGLPPEQIGAKTLG